ncbi:MAG: archaeosortase/exosortase family protein, partial [Nanoarchaeota archaeon]|nr:archaeosortase/exosortase family protein [Nanoarchaeota archaeon]
LIKANNIPDSLFLTLVKYGSNALFVIFVALAVYNLKFVKEQLLKYRMQMPVLLVLCAGYFTLIQVFQKLWLVLGTMVAKSIHFLLSLTFSDVVIRLTPGQAPRLGVGKFIVGISDACSGIDSLLLFLSIYVALFALDWKMMHRRRMLILLIPGIVGTIAYNILRVYLLMLVGIFISPEFAIDMFHTNVGWILFLTFFIVYWHFGSKWVYKKHEHAKKAR